MKVNSELLNLLHLDKSYLLLTGKNVKVLYEMFKLLDIHGEMALNDIQFFEFMRSTTDINNVQIYRVFDMFDVDGSGTIDFDEFYLLICILIAIKDGQEKQFIYRHSRTVFDLLDEDGSNDISAKEFANFGFLFNFQGGAVEGIFHEFDVSGDQELDYKEFKMFAMACIDKQTEIDNEKKLRMQEKQKKAMLKMNKTTINDMGLKLPSYSEMKLAMESDDHGSVMRSLREPSKRCVIL